MAFSVTFGVQEVITNLWSDEVCDERPPNEDAIVLNSTCLICGVGVIPS